MDNAMLTEGISYVQEISHFYWCCVVVVVTFNFWAIENILVHKITFFLDYLFAFGSISDLLTLLIIQFHCELRDW